MTLDQKALESAQTAFVVRLGSRGKSYTPSEAVEAAIEAYLDASRSAIVEEPMPVAKYWEWDELDSGEWDAKFRHRIEAYKPIVATGNRIINVAPLYASPQPHTGRAGVTEEMVDTLRWYAEAAWTHEGDATVGLLGDGGKRARASLNAALTVEPVAGEVTWAVEQWRREVQDRPLTNVHRRSLDDTWRQVIRHFGGDDHRLVGLTHDELLANAKVAP